MRRAQCLPAGMTTCPCCDNFIRSGRNMRARNESPSLKKCRFCSKSIQIANCARTCMRRAECLPAYMATCPCCGVCNFTRSGRNMRARNESPSYKKCQFCSKKHPNHKLRANMHAQSRMPTGLHVNLSVPWRVQFYALWA